MSVRKFSEIIWKQQKAKGKLIFKNYDKTHKRHVSDYQSTWKINDKKFRSAIILCGGKGTRLGSIGKKFPKTLVKIQGRDTLVYNKYFKKE